MNKSIAIIGAGVMGKGVAQRLAQDGNKVILLDLDKDILPDCSISIMSLIRLPYAYKVHRTL